MTFFLAKWFGDLPERGGGALAETEMKLSPARSCRNFPVHYVLKLWPKMGNVGFPPPRFWSLSLNFLVKMIHNGLSAAFACFFLFGVGDVCAFFFIQQAIKMKKCFYVFSTKYHKHNRKLHFYLFVCFS